MQLSTFMIAGHLYGIDVRMVQEVVKPMKMTRVPLAPEFVKGLINLRGQLATAIDLRYLFKLSESEQIDSMNVVCQTGSSAISLLVDEIGDVIEIDPDGMEPVPQTISRDIRKFMTGVYKVSDTLLSVIDLSGIMKFINSSK
ncbi:MAG: chemotaxis protein CheW [Deltaproteobacteria bacterium]|nr:chemotaxis protein CheW [Deltaproteobacteria bacterium]